MLITTLSSQQFFDLPENLSNMLKFHEIEDLMNLWNDKVVVFFANKTQMTKFQMKYL